jgi:hypothetical protein
MLEKSGDSGTNIFNRIEKEMAMDEVPLADSEKEADEVARAVGLPTEFSASTVLRRSASRGSEAGEGLALGRVISGQSTVTSGPESPSPTGGLSPDLSLVDPKSPETEDLESPDSEVEDPLIEKGKADSSHELANRIPDLKLDEEN